MDTLPENNMPPVSKTAKKRAAPKKSMSSGKDEASAKIEARTQYLIECFRLAHDEGMSRISKRENLLMIGLIAQVIIAALANQVELFDIKAPASFTLPAIFSCCIALVICSLYAIQNNAIGFLSDYVAGLSKVEQSLNGGIIINNWDSSPRYRSGYIVSSILNRYAIPFFAFFILPAINYFWFGSGFDFSRWTLRGYPLYLDMFNGFCLGFVAFTIHSTVRIRRKNSSDIE